MGKTERHDTTVCPRNSDTAGRPSLREVGGEGRGPWRSRQRADEVGTDVLMARSQRTAERKDAHSFSGQCGQRAGGVEARCRKQSLEAERRVMTLLTSQTRHNWSRATVTQVGLERDLRKYSRVISDFLPGGLMEPPTKTGILRSKQTGDQARWYRERDKFCFRHRVSVV